jgi:hypothetical protein
MLRNWAVRIGRQVYGATILLLTFSSFLGAQEPSEPKPQRFEVSPFFGYRTSMSFPENPNASVPNPRIVLDSSPSYGASFGFRLREDDMVEIRWARQDSHIYSEDIQPALPRQQAALDQVHLDCSHEFVEDDWRGWVRPFLMASVGGTNISGGTDGNFTRFSFGLGGGIRFYASRHFGFKIQAEWVPVYADPQGAFVCGGGCVVAAGGTLSSQGEILVAPIVRF